MKVITHDNPFPVDCCAVLLTDEAVTLRIINQESGKYTYVRLDPRDVKIIQRTVREDEIYRRCTWRS